MLPVLIESARCEGPIRGTIRIPVHRTGQGASHAATHGVCNHRLDARLDPSRGRTRGSGQQHEPPHAGPRFHVAGLLAVRPTAVGARDRSLAVESAIHTAGEPIRPAHGGRRPGEPQLQREFRRRPRTHLLPATRHLRFHQRAARGRLLAAGHGLHPAGYAQQYHGHPDDHERPRDRERAHRGAGSRADSAGGEVAVRGTLQRRERGGVGQSDPARSGVRGLQFLFERGGFAQPHCGRQRHPAPDRWLREDRVRQRLHWHPPSVRATVRAVRTRQPASRRPHRALQVCVLLQPRDGQRDHGRPRRDGPHRRRHGLLSRLHRSATLVVAPTVGRVR